MKRFLESAELSEVELGTASSRREERQSAEIASGRDGGRVQGAMGREQLNILGCTWWGHLVTMNEGSPIV